MYLIEVLKKKATGTKTAAGSRSMKRNLDMGMKYTGMKYDIKYAITE